MKKIILITASLLSVALVIGCKGKKDNTPPYEKGDPKTQKGIGTIFNEVLGYNTKDAAVFQDGEERYVVYASNEEAKGEQVFAARKATLVDGKWAYQEKHIILKGSTGWDKNIFNPSVITSADSEATYSKYTERTFQGAYGYSASVSNEALASDDPQSGYDIKDLTITISYASYDNDV